ncbi:hypothetical protein ES319_D07G194500v1 [Gossypium barbadense]|uniref:Catalase core domain-containing protein n=1 Tax=Gossypium barbadense TaxID=3634 RepID=A0A5J5QUQ7_GOSBA|nr:hypothetical protein ES319_D07G194500v1 [Gossypium barbadense]
MKFPDMVHALKPNPKSHIQENWRILDFFSHHPESLHMFTFLFDDIGIPQDYRHMDGSGVHTYTLIDKAGKAHYVKFHWKPTCGVKNLLEDEAITVGGANHSHATQDLYDSIAAGNYPEWKVFIQVMDPADEDRFDFDPLDVTKTWPEDILPLQPVGRMVLSKNIDNFFAENEQLAFCPSVIVPGIYYSDYKLLQTRIFSYSDTQKHRLGPNYLQLPANAPKCVHHNNHHEGFMNFMHRDEEVNYFPSRFDPARHAEKYPIPTAICSGKRDKIWFLCVWVMLIIISLWFLNYCIVTVHYCIDPLHQTGKNALLNAGLRPCLIQGPNMRSAAFGSHTGRRRDSHPLIFLLFYTNTHNMLIIFRLHNNHNNRLCAATG